MGLVFLALAGLAALVLSPVPAAAGAAAAIDQYEVVEPSWIEGGYVELNGSDADAVMAQIRPIFAKAPSVSITACGGFHVLLMSRSAGPGSLAGGGAQTDGCYLVFEGPTKVQFLTPQGTRTYAFTPRDKHGVSGICFVTRLEQTCLVTPVGGLVAAQNPPPQN